MSTALSVARRGIARDPGEQALRDAFGQRLESLMQSAGLNQRALANSAGLDRSVITRLINGEHRVNGDQLARLSRALNLSAADLMPMGGARNQAPVARNLASGSRDASPVDNSIRTATGGGYTVRTHEAEYIARELDDIEDKTLRKVVMAKCSELIGELTNPQSPRAETVPGHARSPK